MLCCSNFSVANGGIRQVRQHAQGLKHTSAVSGRRQSKLHISGTGTVTVKPGSGRELCHDDKVTRAEVLMIFRMIKHNHSFASQEDLSDVLKVAFADDHVVRDMSLGATKASYSVAYGLGPYYHQQLVDDVKRSMYTLIIDETTTQQNYKQLDLLVRYWSVNDNKVKINYFDSCFLQEATADKMLTGIMGCLSSSGLFLTNLIMLSSDGPNVNKSLKQKLNTAVVNAGGSPMVDFGTCNIHIIHNSFKAGFKAVHGWSVEEFVSDIFSWFKNFPSRCEKYEKLLASFTDDDVNSKFLRFVESRWLCLSPVVRRVLENVKTLREFFLKGKFDSTTTGNARFKRICLQLQQEHILEARLHFIAAASCDFERLLTKLQTADPIVHVLINELRDFIQCFLARFVKREVLNNKSVTDLAALTFRSDIILAADELDIGTEARKIVNVLKRDQKTYGAAKTFGHDVTKFFKAIGEYLLAKLPLNNVLLQNLTCLSPQMRTSEPEKTVQMIAAVVNALPCCNTAEMKDNVTREWREYQAEVISDDYFVAEKGQDANGMPFVKYRRIDNYWQRVLQITDSRGEAKYPHLGKVVRVALCLSHGQADVERGFSLNKAILSDRTALSERALCGLRTVKDVIEQYSSIVEIPITRGILSAQRNAYQKYKAALDATKTAAANEERQAKREREIDNRVKELKEKKLKLETSRLQAEMMINEGSDRLTASIKSGKLDDMLPAQALIQSGNKTLQECRDEIRMINEQLDGGSHRPANSSTAT